MQNYSTLGEPAQRCVYIPLERKFSDAMTLYVRSKGDPRQILVPVQHEIHAIAPRVFAPDARTGSKLVGQALLTAKMGVSFLRQAAEKGVKTRLHLNCCERHFE